MVTLAIVGVITAASAPFFLSYWRAAAIRAAARELTSALNRGRQLAITRNGVVCVLADAAGRLRLDQGPCGTNNFWTGPGTDAQGWMHGTSNNITLAPPAASVAFTNLGAAAPGGVYTLRNPADNRTLTVTVAGSGRITTP
jgi:Tfp pilus assembly protein FimT